MRTQAAVIMSTKRNSYLQEERECFSTRLSIIYLKEAESSNLIPSEAF